jgi:hypothetical protein
LQSCLIGGIMGDGRPPGEKSPFAEMRDMGVRGLFSTTPIIVAATLLRSVRIGGRMIVACQISSRASFARPAASAARMSSRTPTGKRCR